MTTIIDPKSLDEYLATLYGTELHARLDFIEEQINLHKGEEGIEPFFKGEKAFHSGQYEKSLNHYMQGRGIGRFEFFCYRATAFLSSVKGDNEKASLFVEKALKERPEDPPCLALKTKLSEIPAVEEKTMIDTVQTSPFIAAKLGVDLQTEEELEQRIQSFHQENQGKYQAYASKAAYSEHLPDHSLWVFNGWETMEEALPPKCCSSEGGLFIRWNGKGIAINPGHHFLKRFHEAGLHLSQLDFVIVTRNCEGVHADISQIYDLNYQLNKISPELHLIHYYLNHKAYQSLAHILKPNFKQERNTVHSLELFLDSQDVEKEDFGEGITLFYFASGSRGLYQNNSQGESLGIRLDLTSGTRTVRLGYVSGSSWSPALASSFTSLDLLIAGFGNTNPNDYGKLNYNDNTLGYFGSFTLLDELKPKLFLVSEFEGNNGDIRMEVVRKLRKEFTQANPQSSTSILPGDHGMQIELKSGMVKCSVNDEILDPSQLQVIKTKESFGKLRYLSPTCFL